MTDPEIEFEFEVKVRDSPPDADPIEVIETDLDGGTFPLDRRTIYHLNGLTARGVRFVGRPESFHASGSTFMACDFTGFRPRAGSLGWSEPVTYRECTFDGTDLSAPSPGDALFDHCSFRGTRIHGWSTYRTGFVECVFTGSIRGTVFWGRHPFDDAGATPNPFIGNDFSGADLLDTSFRLGIDLLAQRLPEGPEYLLLDRWRARHQRALAAVQSWPSRKRHDAMEILEIFDDERSGDFRFLDRGSLAASKPEEDLQAIFELLEGPLPHDA